MSQSQSLAHVIRHETLVSGLSNAVFNGLAAWLLLRGGSNLTLFGAHSYAVDVAATAFILPFIVTLIVIPLNRRKVARGTLSSINLDTNRWLEARLQGFPSQLGWQAVLVGLLTMVIATPLIVLPLWALGILEFTPLAYALFKGAWAGLMAAAITRPLLLLALKSK